MDSFCSSCLSMRKHLTLPNRFRINQICRKEIALHPPPDSRLLRLYPSGDVMMDFLAKKMIRDQLNVCALQSANNCIGLFCDYNLTKVHTRCSFVYNDLCDKWICSINLWRAIERKEDETRGHLIEFHVVLIINMSKSNRRITRPTFPHTDQWPVFFPPIWTLIRWGLSVNAPRL